MVLRAEQLNEAMQAAPLETTADYSRVSFRAMGTTCDLVFRAGSPAAARDFKQSALEWLAGFEARCSRFLPDSLVSAINEQAGRSWVEVDADTESLLALCDWFHWSTRGIFDATMLPVIRLWDYHAENPVVPDDAAVAGAKDKVGWSRVQRRPGAVFLSEAGMSIDLGGIGKEYAVDRVMEMALARNITDVLVNFGHDLRAHGEPPEKGPWRIGLESPNAPGRCWAGVATRDGSVCTSGNYLRRFVVNGRAYGHILDPRTGRPVDNGCGAVSVIAPTCTEAGIFATTAYILGGAAGVDFLNACFQAEGCVWVNDNVMKTRRFDESVI
jgi:FAD:protein FMN transferase